MSIRTPWKKPPLLEVIFEIRFPPVDDYAIFVGGMASIHRERFPIHEKLPSSDLPAFVQFEGALRHRFINNEKTFLFQTGTDIISVNDVKYAGFDKFLSEVKSIIYSACEFINLSNHIKVSLRYINKFEQTKDIFSVLTIKNPFNDFNITTTKEISLKQVKQHDDLFLKKIIVFPATIGDISDNLILDLEAFSFLSDTALKIDLVFDWCSKAHDLIWNNFEELISENEKKDRK